MIIRLTQANFSSNNIGQLDSWNITRNFDGGVESINGIPTSVKKTDTNSYSGTVVLKAGYAAEDATVTVFMGGNDITSTAVTSKSGNTISINLGVITGKVTITVSTGAKLATPVISLVEE